MKSRFEFIAGENPAHFQFPGALPLYSTSEYQELWPEYGKYIFCIRERASEEIKAIVYFQIINGTAISVSSAPFGSIWLSENLDFETISTFLLFIEKHLLSQGIQDICIKHPPRIYQSSTYELMLSSLAMNGYTISNVDINQYIEISPASFDKRIHPMEKRNLDKCRKSGLIFREHPNTEAKMVFNCIRSFRKTRKVPVNIELDTLTRQIKQLPDRYTFFSAALEDEMVAATICVKVTDRILYNFLPAHDSRYNMYSPMVFLMDHVYRYAQKGGYEYLDLGISSLNNAPQSGLIRFKQRLGSQINTRFTFTKKIKLDD